MAKEGEAGNLISVVVFVAVFMSIFALLISGVSGIFGADDEALNNGMRDKSLNSGDFAGFEWWTNDEDAGWLSNATGYRTGSYWDAPPAVNVAWANLLNDFVSIHTDATPYVWSRGPDYSSEHAIRIYLMDDGSIILFRQGGGGDRWWQQITPADILSATKRDENGGSIARLAFDIGVKGTLVILFPGGYDPLILMQSVGHYEFGIGQMLVDKTVASDVWSIVGDLLTFNLQATGVWWIDYLFSVAVWSMLLYVAFMMITRLIPFT